MSDIKTDSEPLSALWSPAWYELDQTLVLGERQKYWFFEAVPAGLEGSQNEIDLVFFNQPDPTENCSVRYAKIVEMSHPTLGQLLKIDADGLDYIFFPVDGEEIVVNAEEHPGVASDANLEIKTWSVRVQLEDVSEPVVYQAR